MVQAFIDDSGWDGKSPAFVLAGYVAKVEQWEAFVKEWQAVLDLPEPNSLPYWRMSESFRFSDPKCPFYGWTSQQRDDRLKKFVPVINRHVLHGIVSVVPIEPYLRLFKGTYNPDALDRPYFLTFFSIMVRLFYLTQQLNLDDRIEFIFDRKGDESAALLQDQYDKFIELAPPELRKLSAGRPRTDGNDVDILPLQAADIIAWHARRYYYDLCRGKDPTKEPSNEFLANLFRPRHDVLEVWTEEKLAEAANKLWKERTRMIVGSMLGTKMTLPILLAL
jgi:hypothetical protein